MRIGWDLDGIGYDFKKSNCDFEVGRGNLHRSLENCSDKWHYYLGWGDLTTPEWLVTYAEGVDAGEILWKGEPFPDFVEVARALEIAGHENIVITDRSIGKDPQGATKFWLNEIRFPYHELHFNPDKTIVPTDFFIEDKVENADALNAAGTKAFLFNRPWNAPYDDGRLRVESLWDYYKEITA